MTERSFPVIVIIILALAGCTAPASQTAPPTRAELEACFTHTTAPEAPACWRKIEPQLTSATVAIGMDTACWQIIESCAH